MGDKQRLAHEWVMENVPCGPDVDLWHAKLGLGFIAFLAGYEAAKNGGDVQ